MEYNTKKLWELGRQVLSTKYLFWIIIMFCYLLMDVAKYYPELCTKLFFTFLAFSFVILANQQNNKKWFLRSIFFLTIYNVIDELSGRANILDWWEIPGAIITFTSNYFYDKTKQHGTFNSKTNGNN